MDDQPHRYPNPAIAVTLWLLICSAVFVAVTLASASRSGPESTPAVSLRQPHDGGSVLPSRDAQAGTGSPMAPVATAVPSPGVATPSPSAVVPVRRTATTPTIADARAYALRRLGSVQYRCLSALVQRESRWRVDARNRRSGAYGLPQALPGSKMASVGADWRTNPVTQLRWMIAYVGGRYGTACRALDLALTVGWY